MRKCLPYRPYTDIDSVTERQRARHCLRLLVEFGYGHLLPTKVKESAERYINELKVSGDATSTRALRAKRAELDALMAK